MEPRRQTTQKSSRKTLIQAVGGIIYRADHNGDIEVLLMRKRGGYWTLPKGKLKQGEDDNTALTREIAEETGINGSVGDLVQTVRYMTPRRQPPRRKQVTYYLFHAEGGVLCPNRTEQIVQLRWFPIRVTLKRIQRRRVRRIIALAIDMITL
ncbi:MAG TPA: NUDIX domain-containing protein [Roseiflexaceae bacterium]|nr:NUDIX domain-containing protein [Roseiflexaceae bacterium]HMP42151.1 NUDIX domain-containing protein [Roseiflexaceae bacterium]